METVEIETVRGKFALEIGENSRAFLWLFNMTQDELVKFEMNPEIVAGRLVKVSGSNPQTARDFASTVANISHGHEPARGWGIWAGQYAKKFAAEKCKHDIKRYLLVFIGGLLLSALIAASNLESETGEILQILLLLGILLTILGFYKVVLLSLDWFSFRDSAWPEQDGMNNP
ncbi:MAG: hypothetical protein AB9873_14910 [Syntrophobacteraceae bacterium]